MIIKPLLSLVLVLSCSVVSKSQTICEELITFAAKSDRDSLICCIENKVNNRIKEVRSVWNNNIIDSLSCTSYKRDASQIVNIHIDRNNTIVMPCVRFFSMDAFNQDSSIYDHIKIDKYHGFVLAEIDERERLVKLINLPYLSDSGDDGIRDFSIGNTKCYYASIKNTQKMRTSIKRVLTQDPDLIVFCPRLGGDGKRILSGIYDFLFIKNGLIYLYRTSNKKVYELNEYAHMLLKKYCGLYEWER